MADTYRPRLPSHVTLPDANLIPGKALRAALGDVCRGTILNWRANAGFPAPWSPNGIVQANRFFTNEVVQWLAAHGVVVERGD